jgi:hypothetical protein
MKGERQTERMERAHLIAHCQEMLSAQAGNF